MERKQVLISFGDILGFGSWTRRAYNSPEESQTLIKDIYKEWERFSNETHYYVKFLGDGLMNVLELESLTESKKIGKFLYDNFHMAQNVQRIIKRHYPRPEGFRLRIVQGYVWKIYTNRIVVDLQAKPCDTTCAYKSVTHAEYVGYIVNLAQRLLEVMPEKLCIFHESVKEIAANLKINIKLKHLDKPTESPRGVDPIDLENLHSFSF